MAQDTQQRVLSTSVESEKILSVLERYGSGYPPAAGRQRAQRGRSDSEVRRSTAPVEGSEVPCVTLSVVLGAPNAMY
eukprot:scaffold620736_cov55-Prasinocladus_malaysianus.AAC.1